MYTVGLTGGIGSGKSTVAKMFAQLGIFCIDLDDVARIIVKPSQPALTLIADFFRNKIPDILLANGELNRPALRSYIFLHPEAKAWLDATLHPLINAYALEQIQNSQSLYAILVSPLLFEKAQTVDASIVIDVPESTQITRASLRDNSSPEQIQQIMSTQYSRSERLAQATYVVDNNLSREFSWIQATDIHHAILAKIASLNTLKNTQNDNSSN